MEPAVSTWVESRATPLEFDEAASHLRSALRAEVGAPVSVETLALALAKTGLETGRWQKIFLWNWGNVKANASTYRGMHQTFACNEVIGGKVVWFSPRGRLDGKGGKVVAEAHDDPPGHPQTRFRAYANATDGAYEYVSFQARELPRYRTAWNLLLGAHVEGYVRALSAANYFTAPVETYLKTVQSLYSEFLLRLKKKPYVEVDVPDFWDWQADAVRAVGLQFDDIGIIRSEAIRDLSRDTEPPEAPPTLRDPKFDEPTLPSTPRAKSEPPGAA
jgi:hypothetical protein